MYPTTITRQKAQVPISVALCPDFRTALLASTASQDMLAAGVNFFMDFHVLIAAVLAKGPLPGTFRIPDMWHSAMSVPKHDRQDILDARWNAHALMRVLPYAPRSTIVGDEIDKPYPGVNFVLMGMP